MMGGKRRRKGKAEGGRMKGRRRTDGEEGWSKRGHVLKGGV